MTPSPDRTRSEARWPAALTVITLVGLLVAVPGRLRLLPVWMLYATAIVVLVPWLLSSFGRKHFPRAEPAAMALFFIVAIPSMLVMLVNLVLGVIRGSSGIGGLQLFVTSGTLWIANVLIFALVFWYVDRDGPNGRAADAPPLPDWLFPQYGLPPQQAPPQWRPRFVDYLYLALSTATAFSTTDVAPLTARAKRLMMLELSISLVMIVVLGARAINILGG